MKKLFNLPLKLAGVGLLLLFFTTTPAYSQDAKLKVEVLDKLADKCSESVDVTLDGVMLQLAMKFLSNKPGSDEAKVREVISGLKGIYVKNYQFTDKDQYSQSDVDSIRQQLQAPGWLKLVSVRSKHYDNVDVYIMSDGTNISGLAVIATEPRELTVVNIVGPIDLEKIGQLDGHFGIHDLDFNDLNINLGTVKRTRKD